MKGVSDGVKIAAIVVFALLIIAVGYMAFFSSPNTKTSTLTGQLVDQCRVGETTCSGNNIYKCTQQDVSGSSIKLYVAYQTCPSGTTCSQWTSNTDGLSHTSCIGQPQVQSSCNEGDVAYTCAGSGSYIISQCTNGKITATQQTCPSGTACDQSQGKCVASVSQQTTAGCAQLGGDAYCRQNGFDSCSLQTGTCQNSNSAIQVSQVHSNPSDPITSIVNAATSAWSTITSVFTPTPTYSTQPVAFSSNDCTALGGDSYCQRLDGANYVCSIISKTCVSAVQTNTNPISAVTSAVSSVFSPVTSSITNTVNSVVSSVDNAVNSLISGVTNLFHF